MLCRCPERVKQQAQVVHKECSASCPWSFRADRRSERRIHGRELCNSAAIVVMDSGFAGFRPRPGNDAMEITIIGGGICGLTLALNLHARGIGCRVYEAAPELKELGVGITLLPHAM